LEGPDHDGYPKHCQDFRGPGRVDLEDRLATAATIQGHGEAKNDRSDAAQHEGRERSGLNLGRVIRVHRWLSFCCGPNATLTVDTSLDVVDGDFCP
jgi:hypothetical protein